jgi:anti-anti-sigma factor
MADPTFQAVPTEGDTLRLVGELDMSTVAILTAALESLPEEAVTLDLSELAFVDSSGLHEIARYARSLNGQAPLILANVPDDMTRLLALTKFDQLDGILIQ